MNYKIYDYDKNSFKRIINNDGDCIYYIKVKNVYVEVSRNIYLVCKRSYEKIKYDRKREGARSVQYFENIDQVTSLVFLSEEKNINSTLYLRNLADLVIKEIYKLPPKYKNIAISIFIEELSERKVANKLMIPKSTVHKRKTKIKKILQEKLKNGGQL